MIYLLIPLILVVIAGVFFLFFIRRDERQRRPFAATAAALGLSLTYAHPHDLMMAGKYRSYSASVVSLSGKGTPPLPCYKASLSMINPQSKLLMVSKGAIWEDQRMDRSRMISLKDTFSTGLVASSNDLMFSSVLLSDKVKEAIEQFFAAIHAGELIFVEDELSLIVPAEKGASAISASLDLLADIKDSLRPQPFTPEAD